MRLDRAQQTQQATEARAQEQHGSGQAHRGFAGGSHKGTTYRHAPRAQAPARRNTGPAPRARPRPAPNTRSAGHPEDDHAQLPPSDPQQLAQMSMQSVSGAKGQQRSGGSADPEPRGSLTDRSHSPPPPPGPPVGEGAALRQSRKPAAARMLATPVPGGMPAETMFDAVASLYFGNASSAASTRLATLAAAARHRSPDSAAPTLAEVKAAVMAWCAKAGKPPSGTEAERNANLLFPIFALRALRPLPEGPQGLTDARNALLQRATLPSPQERRS